MLEAALLRGGIEVCLRLLVISRVQVGMRPVHLIHLSKHR